MSQTTKKRIKRKKHLRPAYRRKHDIVKEWTSKMAFKPKTKDYTSKNGNNYTFQTVAPSQWADLSDQMTNDAGKLMNSKSMPLVLEHIVVKPSGMKMDDFESWTELQEVVIEALKFQSGGQS